MSDVTEFGAYPDKVPLEKIEQIEGQVTAFRKIGAGMHVSMGNHPAYGPVLILNYDDGTGGFVFAEQAKFV